MTFTEVPPCLIADEFQLGKQQSGCREERRRSREQGEILNLRKALDSSGVSVDTAHGLLHFFLQVNDVLW